MAEPPPFTDEDAKAFYEAASYRFEWQERYEQRFAARVRQMLTVLTALGAATFFFGEKLLSLEATACPVHPAWDVCAAWHLLHYLVSFLAIASVVATGLVVRVFWSARYSALPGKPEYKKIWNQADELHKENKAKKNIELSRSALMMNRMADALLDIVDKNAQIDRKRQDWLDLSKKVTVTAAGLLLTTILTYFYIQSNLT